MSRRLLFDDGTVRRYEVTDDAGHVVGFDDEPSNPVPDPTAQLAAAVQALADVVVAKTSATAADVASVIDALDGLAG